MDTQIKMGRPKGALGKRAICNNPELKKTYRSEQNQIYVHNSPAYVRSKIRSFCKANSIEPNSNMNSLTRDELIGYLNQLKINKIVGA